MQAWLRNRSLVTKGLGIVLIMALALAGISGLALTQIRASDQAVTRALGDRAAGTVAVAKCQPIVTYSPSITCLIGVETIATPSRS